MKDKVFEYIKEHTTFTIPELQVKLSLPYDYLRYYIARLEEDGDIELDSDGLSYKLITSELLEEEEDDDFDLDDYDDEDMEEYTLHKKETIITHLEEEPYQALFEKSSSILLSKKSNTWVLGQCIIDNQVDISLLQKKLFLPKYIINDAITWMKNLNFISDEENPKVLLSKNLFLELFGEEEPFLIPTTLIPLHYDLDSVEKVHDVLEVANLLLRHYVKLSPTINLAGMKELVNRTKETIKGGFLYEYAFTNLCYDNSIKEESDFEKFKVSLLKDE